jgi:hypothetical protein
LAADRGSTWHREAPDPDPLLAHHIDRAGLEVVGDITEVGQDDRRLLGRTAPG